MAAPVSRRASRPLVPGRYLATTHGASVNAAATIDGRLTASYLGWVRIEILASARKHHVSDEDIVHALHNAVFDYPEQGDHELTMAIGPARNGVTMLEVGYLMSEDGLLVVIHAMGARRKYLEGG